MTQIEHKYVIETKNLPKLLGQTKKKNLFTDKLTKSKKKIHNFQHRSRFGNAVPLFVVFLKFFGQNIIFQESVTYREHF